MHQLDSTNVEDYLRRTRRIKSHETVGVTELHGGVSNVVLYITKPGETSDDFILKQARPRLRVAEPWFCSIERIWREVDVLRVIQRILENRDLRASSHPRLCTPKLLFEDRDNYLFGMTAAPLGHVVWKQQLLEGHVDQHVVDASARFLSYLHGATWRDELLANQLGDRSYFKQLRLEPYFSHVTHAHPDLKSTMDELSEDILANRQALVHGDFSPKNILVYSSGLMLVDFEVGHFGDPAFDLGFLLSHLVLKALRAGDCDDRYLLAAKRFWHAYRRGLSSCSATESEIEGLSRRALRVLAGCALARVDGKSPVDYLASLELVRRVSRRMLKDPPRNWDEVAAALSS